MLGWWRQQDDSPPLYVLLYTRAGCHLCETAHARLQQAQRRYGFRLEVVDIDSDAALVSAYGEQVPVVTVNGKVRFRGTVNPSLLERLLRAECRASRRAGGSRDRPV